jgi:hypothetical protein
MNGLLYSFYRPSQHNFKQLFEFVVGRRTIEGIYELTQQDAFSKEWSVAWKNKEVLCYCRDAVQCLQLLYIRVSCISILLTQ